MRECKIISKTEGSIESRKICQLLVENLNQIEGSVMDADCKKAIQKIRRGSYIPKYSKTELRLDIVFEDKVGVVSSMGTTAIISRRLLSALYHFNAGTISEIIFIAHSPANAWYQNNAKKPNKVNGNGNRATSESLLGLIEEISESIDLPITVIELTDKICLEEYNGHFP
jgi:hypothetical protein